MRMGFEKARRRDLARGGYNPIDSFRPPNSPKRHHRRHKKHNPVQARKRIHAPPFQLPDQQRTFVALDRWGQFKGQSTFWKRGDNWTLIGVTRTLCGCCYDGNYPIPVEQIRGRVEHRGLTMKWLPATHFSERPEVTPGVL